MATRKKSIKSKKKTKKTAKKPAKRLVKKAVVKKSTGKKITPKKSVAPRPIGRVTHFYTSIKVAVIKFSRPVKLGVRVEFRGATTGFSQNLDSMQYDHKPVATAPKGKQVGVKVRSRVREGDQVYL